MRTVCCALTAFLGLQAAIAVTQEPDTRTPVAPDARVAHFEAHVRPLLIGRCDECHAETAEGGLRVDSRAALLSGGDAGPAIDLSAPERSLLIRAVRHEAGVPKMPKKRTRLTDAEVAELVQWIRDGAVWPEASATSAELIDQRIAEHRDFWSFRPLAPPLPPEVTHADWPRTEVDLFVLARLEQQGLQPVAAAEPRDWLRRVTFGLTGLPPTPTAMDEFLADSRAEARGEVVDRLLASPAYGEHWARWWLDVARYAEDDCRSQDDERLGFSPYPEAFRYRDWVIQALNEDLPYAEFLRAQLAADHFGRDARVRHLPALGFLGLGPWLYDNGALEVTRADERHDRVDAVTRGMLGLTVACARCHDHKSDPISSRDYYALAGVFLNTRYKEYPLVPAAYAAEYDRAEERLYRERKLLREVLRDERQHHASLLTHQTARYMLAAWQVLGPERKEPELVADAQKLDGELLARWIRFLQKPPINYPYLRDWQRMIASKGGRDEAKNLADQFQGVLVDVMLAMREIDEQNEIIRAKALPGNQQKRRAQRPDEFLTNDDFCPGCGLELNTLPKDEANLWTDVFERDLDHTYAGEQGEDAFRPGLLVYWGNELLRRLGDDRRRAVEELQRSIRKAKQTLGPKYAHVHGVEDTPAPRHLEVHLRGDPFKLGDAVPRRFLHVLQPAETADQPFLQGSGRAELAERIVSHPLAARVLVNRVWKHHFGAGLVDTPSNFGVLGERPSHPELLEHLAERFVAQGGSLKALHRELVLSATYGSASQDDPAARAIDGSNRSLWRANEQRLTAEQLRDAMLAVAGTLEPHLYGPSAKLTTTNRRRTIYAHISRFALEPYLALFDFPSPNQSSERRFATNVPTQRLFLMNSDFVQEQAERVALRVASAADDRARIGLVYRHLFQRAPLDTELAAGLEFLREEPMRAYLDAQAAATKPIEPETASAAESDTTTVIEALVEEPRGGAKAVGSGRGDDGDDDGKGEDGAPDELPPDLQPLPVTAFGRYVKVLFCSNEFLFLR